MCRQSARSRRRRGVWGVPTCRGRDTRRRVAIPVPRRRVVVEAQKEAVAALQHRVGVDLVCPRTQGSVLSEDKYPSGAYNWGHREHCPNVFELEQAAGSSYRASAMGADRGSARRARRLPRTERTGSFPGANRLNLRRGRGITGTRGTTALLCKEAEVMPEFAFVFTTSRRFWRG